MVKNFVLAFGGSGVRCVEALSYLCAARCIREPVHILIVDPDAANGNVDDVKSQLQRYHAIQQHVRPGSAETGAFFSTPLNGSFGAESFLWQYPNQNQAFGTLIEYSAQRPEHQQLLDLLYDEDDLGMSFEKGYVGRAHIGSLDLLGTLQQAAKVAAAGEEEAAAGDDPLRIFFRALRSAAQGGGGARLLVYGSIFGGTGASGLPTVPPLVRTELARVQDKIEIACVQLAPYFSFPPGASERDPNSELHQLATQAALYHYAFTETGYQRVYLLGAPDRKETNPTNRPGGIAQRNNAHYVELGAGLAAAHFFGSVEPRPANTQVYACGASEVTWDLLPHAEQVRMRERLVSFTTFCMLHGHFLSDDLRQGRHEGAKWTYDLQKQTRQKLGGQESELEHLRNFSLRYLDWSRDVQQSVGSAPVLLRVGKRPADNDFSKITEGGQGDDREYHDLVAELSRAGKIDETTASGWYINALTRAANTFCEKRYSSWGTAR
jgi:hypothetical protein